MQKMLADQEFLIKQKFVTCQFKGRFYSKRNEVYLFIFRDLLGNEKEWVVKKYSDPRESLKAETEVLTQLYSGGVAVPELIHAGENYIILQYIKGRTLLAWMEEQEKAASMKHLQAETVDMVAKLVIWLKSCYKILSSAWPGRKVILGDVNLRNFIIGDKVYGLDFENCIQGRVEKDIGKLCAYLLTYNPPFTAWKYKLADSIRELAAETMKLNRPAIQAEMSKELAQIACRRKAARGQIYT